MTKNSLTKNSRQIARIFSAAVASCGVSGVAFAWGLQIEIKDGMPDFIDMTRRIDFIGQWSYSLENEAVVLEVNNCDGDDLCVRRVLPSGACSKSMMVVHEDKSVSRRRAVDQYSWRYSGKMNWIDGMQYDMQVDVIDGESRFNGKLPDRADQELVFDGGPSSVGRDAWSGGRAYPVQFLLKFKGKPTCSASSS